jgi:hypothetical protein
MGHGYAYELLADGCHDRRLTGAGGGGDLGEGDDGFVGSAAFLPQADRLVEVLLRSEGAPGASCSARVLPVKLMYFS